MANREQVIVGLTGSIGAGKSTVAEIFEQEGIPVLRADVIAKVLMSASEEMRRAIIEEFGEEAYIQTDGSPGGVLNRQYLAAQIFTDAEKRERLNEIVHPRTIAEQGRLAAQLFAEGHRVVACEAALIFETEGEGRFDYIVVVDAEEESRLRRAALRDNTLLDEIRRRNAAQLPAQHKVERADFVIRNDGTPEELAKTTRFIAGLLKALPPRERLEVEEEEESGDEGEG